MEKTQKRLGREILICYAVIAALLALMIVVGELSNRGVLLDSRGMTATAGNAARILFFGALIGAICRIRRLKRTLADQILLREEQIRQEDERALYRGQKRRAGDGRAACAAGGGGIRAGLCGHGSLPHGVWHAARCRGAALRPEGVL